MVAKENLKSLPKINKIIKEWGKNKKEILINK